MFGRAKKCRTELEHAIMDRSILSDTHNPARGPGTGNSPLPRGVPERIEGTIRTTSVVMYVKSGLLPIANKFRS